MTTTPSPRLPLTALPPLVRLLARSTRRGPLVQAFHVWTPDGKQVGVAVLRKGKA